MLPDVAFPVMEEIKKNGMYGILTTNGTNISDENIRLLADIGWDRIHFSIDGPDAKTHDYLRGVPGTFERAISTIRKLKEYRDSLGKKGPMLNMNTVLSEKNYDRLEEQVELAHSLGIEYMFVEPLIVYSDWGQELKLKEEHMDAFHEHLKKAVALTKKYGIDSNFSRFDRNLDETLVRKSSSMDEVVKADSERFSHPLLSVPCYDPWFHMTIKCDGRVISCDVATDEGDDISKKALSEIWLGPYFERHRSLLMSKSIPEYCRQCNPSHTTQRRRLREALVKQMGRGAQGKAKGILSAIRGSAR
jgi:MoaA/NifB/PqqE/SkfB family radical SAM enzyme